MRMSITAIILFLLVGAAVGYAVCAGQAQARGLRECETCLARDADCEDRSAIADKPIPPRIVRAIRSAAEAANRLAGIEADRAGVSGLIDGPRVWVDLDAIAAVETGHLPESERDAAPGAAGEIGRYQITEGAWNDTMDWLCRNRGWRTRWNFKADARDPQRARVVAGAYLNEVLPRWLTCERLDKTDSTGPVPDCLLSRVAAWNCGAKRVRQAYARWQPDGGKHWIGYLPASTQKYLARYAMASGFVATADSQK